MWLHPAGFLVTALFKAYVPWTHIGFYDTILCSLLAGRGYPECQRQQSETNTEPSQYCLWPNQPVLQTLPTHQWKGQ